MTDLPTESTTKFTPYLTPTWRPEREPEPPREWWLTYFEQRRRALIIELRQIERMLGMEQSIPERGR